MPPKKTITPTKKPLKEETTKQGMEPADPEEEIREAEEEEGEATQRAILASLATLITGKKTTATSPAIGTTPVAERNIVINNKNDDKKVLETVTTVKGVYKLGKTRNAWNTVQPAEDVTPFMKLIELGEADIIEIIKIFEIGKYLGLDVQIGRKKIWALAKRIDPANPRRPIIQALALYCVLGTSWVDKRRQTTISPAAQQLISILLDEMMLDTRLTDSGNVNSLTVGRIVVCFPDLCARVMKTHNARIVTSEIEGLPRYLHFPAARALIPHDNLDLIKAHDKFSAEFQKRISRGRSIGSRSDDQATYLAAALDSPLFSDEQRKEILTYLAKDLAVPLTTKKITDHKLMVGEQEIEVE